MAIRDLTGTKWQLNKIIAPNDKDITFKIVAEIVSDGYSITLPYSVGEYTYEELFLGDGTSPNTPYFKIGSYSGGGSANGYFIEYWQAGGWFGDIKDAGWRYSTYNYSPSVPLDSNTPIISAPLLTITGGVDVTNPSLISWLEANGELQAEPTPTNAVTIEYNGSVIASLKAGQSATLPCKDTLMHTDVVVSVPDGMGAGEVVEEWDGSIEVV
jgi:hypothetical protein